MLEDMVCTRVDRAVCMGGGGGGLVLINESTEIDFLRAAFDDKECGEGGRRKSSSSGMCAAFESTEGEGELRAVWKVSCEANEDGVCERTGAFARRGGMEDAAGMLEASGISMGGREGILGRSIWWVLAAIIRRADAHHVMRVRVGRGRPRRGRQRR